MPLFFRKPRPRTLADIPRRWDALPPGALRNTGSGARPNRIVSGMIIFLSLVMVVSFLALWKSGQFEPAKANGAAQSPAHEALSTILDSARLLMKRSEWSKAETVLRHAIEKFPDDQETRIALAETLIAERKPREAYDQYEKALAIGPRDHKLEYAAGVAASTADRPDRAVEHFSMAQTADPANGTYALMLGTVQRKLGDLEAAKASLLRAVRIDPDKAIAWGTLADIALSENNVNLALQHIERARQLQPDNKDWRLIQARALKRKGEPDKALMLLLPMDASQRREAPVVRLIAECYSMLGRHGDGAAAMADAFASDPTNANLAYDTAVAFERAGNKARALDFAKQAKVLGHKGAAQFIERLNQ